MATYCGQNLSAGKYKRITQGMRQSFYLCFVAAALAALGIAGKKNRKKEI